MYYEMQLRMLNNLLKVFNDAYIDMKPLQLQVHDSALTYLLFYWL